MTTHILKDVGFMLGDEKAGAVFVKTYCGRLLRAPQEVATVHQSLDALPTCARCLPLWIAETEAGLHLAAMNAIGILRILRRRAGWNAQDEAGSDAVMLKGAAAFAARARLVKTNVDASRAAEALEKARATAKGADAYWEALKAEVL